MTRPDPHPRPACLADPRVRLGADGEDTPDTAGDDDE